MTPEDFQEAYKLIVSTFGDDRARARQIAAIRASERRPYVVLAMIRTAATLAKVTKVSVLLGEALNTSYAQMEEGVLTVTDEILQSLENDHNAAENVGWEEDIAEAVAGLARIEVRYNSPAGQEKGFSRY